MPNRLSATEDTDRLAAGSANKTIVNGGIRMMKKCQTLTTAAALLAVIVFAGSTAHAQDQQCQSNFADAYAVYQDKYDSLTNTLQPELSGLLTEMQALQNQASYATLLSHARLIVGGLPTGRMVVTVPDGTVVLDTARTDGNPSDPKSNTYQHFLDKTINENHNSRIAIFAAQGYPCGNAIEAKFSTTDGVREYYFASRLGDYLDNFGTARLSVK
jgi:hypothetical protein